MPRLLQRQEAPIDGRVSGRAPVCIACGNRRIFWVQRESENIIAYAWEVQRDDKLIACGRCRSRNSVLFDANEA
jgi:hypothetical protein